MSEEQPDEPAYIESSTIVYHYNPKYGDGRVCVCGHSYYRHFDPYEQMEAVGCKYCQCWEFVEETERLCKDGGTCHHHCGEGKCFREGCCGPLTISGLNDNWKYVFHKHIPLFIEVPDDYEYEVEFSTIADLIAKVDYIKRFMDSEWQGSTSLAYEMASDGCQNRMYLVGVFKHTVTQAEHIFGWVDNITDPSVFNLPERKSV